MQLQRPVLAVQYLQPRAQSIQEKEVFAGEATCTSSSLQKYNEGRGRGTSSEIARPTAGLC